MDNNQKINCTVRSCKYNQANGNECTLKAIKVTPTENNTSKKSDESMCSSYDYE